MAIVGVCERVCLAGASCGAAGVSPDAADASGGLGGADGSLVGVDDSSQSGHMEGKEVQQW